MNFRLFVSVVLAVLLGLYFAPVAMAGSGKSGQAGSSSSKAQKTPDQTKNDHPSGRDRTSTSGNTQGKSTSDPDGDSNGGADKPGMDGGFDDDKDGNNGCGNDDDFEDDNNGWCGKPPFAGVKAKAGERSDDTEVESSQKFKHVKLTESQKSAVNVLGVTFERTVSQRSFGVVGAVGVDGTARAAGAPAVPSLATGAVMGTSFVRGSAEVAGAAGATGVVGVTSGQSAGTLARTGQSLAMLTAVGLLIGMMGAVLMVVADRRRMIPIPLRTKR